MFDFIEGILVEKEMTRAVLLVQGIGHDIYIPLLASEKLPQLNEKVRLYTYFHVREDIQQLYGFLEKKERNFFKMLISVSGIGPKVALGLLGAIKMERLQQAIVTEDISLISSAPGVGKKTAQRLILELKGKVSLMANEFSEGVRGFLNDGIWKEALLALISLGYNQTIAQKALNKTAEEYKELKTSEELVRKSLNHV